MYKDLLKPLFITLCFSLSLTIYSEDAMKNIKPGDWVNTGKEWKVTGAKSSGDNVGYITDGAFIEVPPVKLSNGLVDRMEFRIAAPRSTGKISVHLNSVKGPKIADLNITGTGGYSTYKIQQTDVEQLSEDLKLFIVFKGGKDICNLKGFRFLLPTQKSPNAIRFKENLGGHKNTSANVDDKIDEVIEKTKKDIIKYRTKEITLEGPPGATVTVKQKRHAFRFGTALNAALFNPSKYFSDVERAKYKEIVQKYFNSAVAENAMKWYSNEREKDNIKFKRADKMLEWCEANAIQMRGHCVYWGRDKLVQKWIKELDDEALRKKIRERAKLLLTRYKGRITEWDVNNEMVHCNYFKKRLGAEIWPKMFELSREYDPDAILYVNDYSILSGGDLGKYVKQIKGFKEAGMPVGGIGVQGHFRKAVNPEKVKKVLDELAQFNLPISVTEYDANTKDENAKALALVNLYSTAFAHPSVVSITMWGFWERKHWRPNAALWKKDWSETKAAKVYQDLIFKQWWTDFDGKIGSDGKCKLRVFYGEHEVTIAGEKQDIKVLPSDDQ